MKRLMIIRYNEIGLKGDNRKYFEHILVRNLKNTIKSGRVSKTRGRIYVKPFEEDVTELKTAVSKTFGVQNYSMGIMTSYDLPEIEKAALEVAGEKVAAGYKRFKVSTRRIDKRFPMRSLEMSAHIGEIILDNLSETVVDLHTPEFIIGVEIRENGVMVFGGKENASGGLPVGTGGRGLLMLSGGIDSPVAGLLAMKRGMKIDGVHFSSPPYTGEKALEKVVSLAKVLTEYNGGRDFLIYNVQFTKAQINIHKNVLNKLSLVIQRRFMLRIATEIAKKNKYKAIITGENIGQVASQTIENMSVIGSATDMLVIRPLITFDKIDIIDIAKKIGTFSISTLPYEDCCTVFVPASPATKAREEDVLRSETNLDIENMIEESIANTKIFKVRRGRVESVEDLKLLEGDS